MSTIKKIAVFGLARSGLSVVEALRKKDIAVIAWDDNDGRRADAQRHGAEVCELNADSLQPCDALVLAPGVPLHFPAPHSVVLAAREAGAEIIGDIELFHRLYPEQKSIGITGTNGKSTTSALLHHVLKSCDVPTALGGNIGVPVFDLPLPVDRGHIVLELSSYQLDLCSTYAPEIAILLNVTPDHIDRHGDIDGYIAAKERIFKGSGTAIISVDDAHCKAVRERVEQGERNFIPISVDMPLSFGVYAKDDNIYDAIDGESYAIGSITEIATLPGQHNQQNMLAVYASARKLGLEPKRILEAFRSYPGLAHRQFPVRTIGHVLYVNDSKATNAEATAKALASVDNIYWIVGGRMKEGGLNGLDPYMTKIRHAYVIGEAMEDFSKWLSAKGVTFTQSETLDNAVKKAHVDAQNEIKSGDGGCVLLSPACASFDQYVSFEKRGDHFVDLVKAL